MTTTRETTEAWWAKVDYLTKKAKKSADLSDPEFPFSKDSVWDAEEMAKAVIVGSVGMIPVVGPVASTIIDAVWSSVKAQKDQNEMIEMFETFATMIIDIIDKRITTKDTADCLAAYVSIQTTLENFAKDVRAFHKNPTGQGLKPKVVRTLELLMDKLEGTLKDNGEFRKAEYCVEEMPIMTLAATVYLLVLRQTLANGKKWGVTQDRMDTYKENFEKYPSEFMAHLAAAYQKGYDKIIANALGYSGVEVFKNVYMYRFMCAHFVFDITKIWKYMVPEKFPDGAYGENVRYAYNIIGNPIDITKIPDGSSYYNPSFTFLQNYMDKEEREAYQGELSNIQFKKDGEWVYSVKPTYRDLSSATGTKEGTIKGNASDGASSVNYPITASNQTSAILYACDIVLRDFQLGDLKYDKENKSLTMTTGKETLFLSYSADHSPGEWSSQITEFKKTHSDVNRDVVCFPASKLSNVFGLNINKEVYTSLGIQKGILDAIIVGFQPVNVVTENYIMPKTNTFIDAQKYYKRSSTTNVVFCKDFVLPTVHAMCLYPGEWLKFQFTPYKLDKLQYTIGIEYYFEKSDANPEGSITVYDYNDVKIFTFTLAECTKSTNYHHFKIKVNKSEKIKLDKTDTSKNIFKFVSKGTVYLQSIVLNNKLA